MRMAALAVGDVETAREIACGTCGLADLRPRGLPHRLLGADSSAHAVARFLDLFDDADTASVARTRSNSPRSWRAAHRRPLRTDFRPLDLALGHTFRSREGTPDAAGRPAIASLIRERGASHRCRLLGHAGTWGFEGRNYGTSRSPRTGVRGVEPPRVAVSVRPSCSSCRMQLQEGTGKRTLHPVQYLAYAYGLLPEIGDRLRKPLANW